MKILHLISSSGLFGAEQVLLSLCRNFNRNNYIAIAGALSDAREPHLELIEKVKIELLPSAVFPCRGRIDFNLVKELKRYIRAQGINVLHTHNYKSNFYGLLAARSSGIPVIATAHGYTDVSRSVTFYEALDRTLLRRFDHVVVVNDKVLPHFPQSKKTVIPNGLDIGIYDNSARYRYEMRKQLDVYPPEFLIGTVGRLSPEKNQMLLLQAMAKLIQMAPHVKILIVGSGPQLGVLSQASVDLGISRHIIFAGLRSDMLKVYPAMDLFVLPSLTEGVPLTILEAMAAKIPVVATRVGGIPDLIQDGITGLLCESNNVVDLTEKIFSFIYHSGQRDQLVANAYQLVQEKYSIEKMVAGYESVYLKVIGKRR